MRILLFAPNYLPATRYGGPIWSSHGLAKALAGLGHDVHVFTTNVDGPGILDVPIGEPVLIDGVSVRYFDIKTPRRIYFSPEMGRALDSELATFDVLHINGMYLWPGPKAARAAERSGVPLVVSPRGMLVPEMIAGKSALAKRVWITLLERRSLAAAAVIHVTSEEEAEGVRRLGLDLAPLALIGNGVDLPDRSPAADEIERCWGGIPRGRRVAFLGRLDWTKGVDLAIEAVLDQPDAHLLIAGHDQLGLRAALEPRLSAAGSQPLGRFIGPVDGKDKWAFLAGADVLLAPSIKESFGMAVAEALAVGTPVICSEGVGVAPIVRRIDPTCVVPRTREALAGALRALLMEEPRRAIFGQRAIEIMAAGYTWPTIAGEMVRLYEGARRGAALPDRAA
jgi:glycosyltransferase involved in cell wall biosynthesis